MNAQTFLSERCFCWCSTSQTSCLLSCPSVRRVTSLAGLDLHVDTGGQGSKLGLSGSCQCHGSWSPGAAKWPAFLPTGCQQGHHVAVLAVLAGHYQVVPLLQLCNKHRDDVRDWHHSLMCTRVISRSPCFNTFQQSPRQILLSLLLFHTRTHVGSCCQTSGWLLFLPHMHSWQGQALLCCCKPQEIPSLGQASCFERHVSLA